MKAALLLLLAVLPALAQEPTSGDDAKPATPNICEHTLGCADMLDRHDTCAGDAQRCPGVAMKRPPEPTRCGKHRRHCRKPDATAPTASGRSHNTHQ